MDEFSLIQKYFAQLTAPAGDVLLGIGDDCALLQPPAGEVLAVTTDTLVSGRHFPVETAPYDIGWKSLAVNLSDLAAMGAQARWFTLALTLPEANQTWIQEFARGLSDLAAQSKVALVGGDTARGPLSITITAMGTVPAGAALKRNGAQIDDVVCVTGTLGDAALALRLLSESDLSTDLRARLDRPTPRLAAGLALRDIAHAAIDLSDGLAGDLAHVLDASGVGAEIYSARLPSSLEFKKYVAPTDALALQLQGGDDYELCVCIAPEKFDEAAARLAVFDVSLTSIGRITSETGLRFLDANGVTIPLAPNGYRHFQ
ncbi:thiamine-phosphate kinase [Stenotrophobium rhamnosiphilum]|uniref:Thiamine-monophosphate kinase n=1 Tax=Stenotrophobium rhamnosiphilum TaxID=2029166 RepID=A0A2T5MHE2_9GAMM|nr:thiamine-phosphate kinase [Stenotrophobium rhamnosiphilum]PTU31998.1 thiamine-phosphate kinase [Stenotrophobium rhamnosiphilum]